MTFAQLAYALQLQKDLNFKRAAEHLHISQPALSVQIQKLEDEIGIRLFDRASSPLTLTEDGTRFLIRAQDIVTRTKQLTEFVRDTKTNYSGTLTIGIIPTLAPFLLPLFSQSLQTDYPELQLIIKELITEQIIDQVRSGELDAGIISTPIQAYGIQAIPLFYEKFYAYVSSDHLINQETISLLDINKDELWMLNEGNCFRDQVTDLCQLGKSTTKRKFVYQSNSIDALIRMVDTHGGITILPELTTLSLSERQEDQMKKLKGNTKAREIGIIHAARPGKERFILLLQEYIRTNVPHHMLDGSKYEIVDPQVST
ncbi:MAG: LysR family hydrogen peroxide-inducible transcriptional activator [Cyclobacteriaceae bacterium]|jgi:LysR family hydrogen peroxide-inducible transcriptional activator